jgi:hypothetical protein
MNMQFLTLAIRHPKCMDMAPERLRRVEEIIHNLDGLQISQRYPEVLRYNINGTTDQIAELVRALIHENLLHKIVVEDLEYVKKRDSGGEGGEGS